MAERAIRIGAEKARVKSGPLVVLAVLAGIFMALGTFFSLTAVTGTAGAVPYGVARILAGVAFSVGPILVVVGGAELFTSNNLIVIAWEAGKVRTREVFRAWAIVYAGNALGATLVVLFALATRDYLHNDGAVGRTALIEASLKASLPFWSAFIHGVGGNAVICLAIWLSYSARSTTDKVVSIVPPITALVAVGFEHSIANMFLLPFAQIVRSIVPLESGGLDPSLLQALTIPAIIMNISAVTLGNLLGGVAVGSAYWFVYVGPRRR